MRNTESGQLNNANAEDKGAGFRKRGKRENVALNKGVEYFL